MVQPASVVNPEGVAVAIDAETAALIAQGQAIDAGSAPPPVDEQGQPIQPPNFAEEAAQLVGLVCSTCEAIFVETGLKFSAETRARVAAGWAPVMEKYDLTGAGLFGQYQAEVGAAIVTIPVVLAAKAVIEGGKKAKAAPATGAETPVDMGFDAPTE